MNTYTTGLLAFNLSGIKIPCREIIEQRLHAKLFKVNHLQIGTELDYYQQAQEIL